MDTKILTGLPVLEHLLKMTEKILKIGYVKGQYQPVVMQC
jgi:hypothetical protein